MDVVPAIALWVLTAVRLPAARAPHRGSVFRATILAAVACTLYVPAVYFFVDPLLGGRNRVGLLTLVSLLLGFWQFRTAILIAAVTNDQVRRHQIAFGRWATGIACAAVTAGFLSSRVDATDQNLPLTYGDQPGMVVFLLTGSGFIIWICVDIARVCHRYIPQMHARAFRSAFTLIAAGCLLFTLVLLDRLLYGAVARSEGESSDSATALTTFYWVGETLAVLLVSTGLFLPRLSVRAKHGAFGLRVRLHLLQVGPVWNRVTSSQGHLILEKNRISRLSALARHPETQLHRRLVEIRDCEMASRDTNRRLSAHDRSVVERAEKALERRAGARLTK